MMGDQPSKLGPYRLLDPLGQGGMGVVYRAEHETTGEAVAVKTVLVPERGLLAGIRREIHALMRLNHPGIVRILEDGFDRGLPWYAMELVDGAPLLAVPAQAATWWTLRLGHGTGGGTRMMANVGDATRPGGGAASLEATNVSGTRGLGATPRLGRKKSGGVAGDLIPTLTLMRRLCSALAYLHGEGLVHRDLKPANILVRADGMPVIVDFGITTRFGDELSREALEVEGGTVGTAAYMAPEQVMGELVDARADLYAFGCILYQLATGRKPFQAASVSAVLQKHLVERPIPPTAFVGGLPVEFDDLVLRLMEKQPERRFGHADDVAAALVRLGAEHEMPGPTPRARAYLYRPRLCGRQSEMSQLETHLAEARKRRGSVVFVGGESGVGKTRLVVELARRAMRAGALVLSGECLAPSGDGGDSALTPFRRPLRDMADLCRDEGIGTSERIFGRRGPVLAAYEPTLALLPGQQDYPSPPDLPAAAAVDRLFDALGGSLGELAGMKRLVLILDDLQWADELSIDFLRYAVERRIFESRSVLVIGTYRTEEVAGEGVGHKRLHALLERREATRVDLGRMDEATVEAMVGEMLALDPPPERFSRFLTEQSEGNPFFVAEYLRASIAEGVLHRGAGGEWRISEQGRLSASAEGGKPSEGSPWEALALPRSLRDLVARRLDGLDAETGRLVDVASVLGREMDSDLLARVARVDRDRMFVYLHDLVRRQVFEDHGSGVVRFVHDKLREVAFDRLTEPRRRRLHAAAARQLEKRPLGESAEGHAALAGHWEGAGEPVKARGHYVQAARLSAARFAHAQADALYRRYLALADRPGPESVEARNELAQRVLMVQGRHREALDEHLAALDEVRAIGDRRAEARTLQYAAEACRPLRLIDLCKQYCDEALAIHRETGSAVGEAQVLSLLGVVLHFEERRLAEAEALYNSALALLGQGDDRQTEGATLAHLGDLFRLRGEYVEARRLIERSVDIHRSAGARASEAAALSLLAGVAASEGRIDESYVMFERGYAVALEAGYRRIQGVTLSNMANMLIRKGSLEQALVALERALVIHREIGNRRFEGMTLVNLAECYQSLGDMERARSFYDASLPIHREVNERQMEGETLSELARWYTEQGQLAEAKQLHAAAHQIHKEVGNTRYLGVTKVRLATIARMEGNLDEAEVLVDEGEGILRGVGEDLLTTLAVCERGQIHLARGESARDALDRAEALVRGSSASSRSESGRAVAELRRAVEADETQRRADSPA